MAYLKILFGTAIVLFILFMVDGLVQIFQLFFTVVMIPFLLIGGVVLAASGFHDVALQVPDIAGFLRGKIDMYKNGLSHESAARSVLQ